MSGFPQFLEFETHDLARAGAKEFRHQVDAAQAQRARFECKPA